MIKHPSITIITVTFNAAGLLDRTINSITSQTLNNIEYLIIDGASRDTTISIIKNFEKDFIEQKFPNIKSFKWISEPDKGLYDAMNKGIDMATGDFLLFLNAGDLLYDDNTLTKVFSGNSDADIFYGETMVVASNGIEIGLRRHKASAKLTWKSLKKGMVVCHQSFIPKRTIVPKYDLSYKCSADIDWEINSLKKAKKIVNTEIVISRFLDGGVSKKTIVPSLKERFKIMVRHYGWVLTIIHHLPMPFRFLAYYLRHRRF